MIQEELTWDENDKKRAGSCATAALELLSRGPQSTMDLMEVGPRPAAYINSLRQMGHVIESIRNSENLAVYSLLGFSPRVKVTDEMQAAYYETPHWKATRAKRLALDGFCCCHCDKDTDTQVHHWKYDLFAEQLCDLTTLCCECHERVHAYDNVQCHFPRYVTRDIADKLTP